MIVWDPIAPGEVLLSAINWTPRLGSADSIATSNWSVSTPSGLTITGAAINNGVGGNFTSVILSTPVLDVTYTVKNTITTTSGNTEVETVQITCAPK